MLYLLCGILLIILVILAILAVRLFLIHKSLREICSGLSHILGTDTQKGISTNALLCVSSRDSHVLRLTAQLNKQLSILRSRQLQYENGDREIRQAVTNISHDLRTPLTAMAGYLELLQKELALSGQQPAETENAGQSQPAFSAEDTGTSQPAFSAKDTGTSQPAFSAEDTGTSRPVYSAEKSARYLAILQNRLDAMKQLAEELFRYSFLLSVQEDSPAPLSLNRALEDSLMAHWSILEQRGITPVISMSEETVTRTLDAAFCPGSSPIF